MALHEHRIVLGTSSRWRRALFSEHFPQLLKNLECISPDIDERKINVDGTNEMRENADPRRLVLAVAHAKAEALIKKCDEADDDTETALRKKKVLLVTMDQVVHIDGCIREKPRDKEECRRFLKSYRSSPLVTVTGVVVTALVGNDVGDGKRRKRGIVEDVDVARQYFTDIPDSVIESLVKKGDVMKCAGGITVESELLKPYLGKRKGSLESIMGFPVDLVQRLMKKASEMD